MTRGNQTGTLGTHPLSQGSRRARGGAQRARAGVAVHAPAPSVFERVELEREVLLVRRDPRVADELIAARRTVAIGIGSLTVLDAYVLAGREAPVDVDGRKQMTLRHRGELDLAGRPSQPDSEQLELGELTHRTG